MDFNQIRTAFSQFFLNIYDKLSSIVEASERLQSVLHVFLLGVHILVAVLAVIIVIRCGRSLLRGKIETELWGFFCLPNGDQLDLTHWENTIGRAKGCDVVLDYPTVSRSHAAVTRDNAGNWTLFALNARNGVSCNHTPVVGSCPLEEGDVVSLGGLEMSFFPSTAEEEREQAQRRTRPGRKVSPTFNLLLVTLVQACLWLELMISEGSRWGEQITGSFLMLCLAMWGLYFVYRARRRTGYEVETLAFFLSTICMTVTASSSADTIYKQLFAIFFGLFLFLALSLVLRDLNLAKKIRYPLVIGASGLLTFNVLFGNRLFGARNWVSLGPISFQPSELVKIVFVIAGAATLDRLFSKRNLIGTIVFSAFCVGCLGLMSDFGTALIFFVAFLVIAFLRTGDLPSVAMVTAAAVFAATIIVKFKPYIVRRFSIWRHVWEDTSGLGYQQTRTMSAIASGGLFGVGANDGWLKGVGAANTDLVFGVVSEELGLIVALCCVACIVIFALFTVKSSSQARSSFYVIAASTVAAMFVMQTMLNVFGSTDILPLTGVTLPFVSCGGSSMMSCWALLAYIKAADTRQNSGFAIRIPKKKRRRDRDGDEEPRPARPHHHGRAADADAEDISYDSSEEEPFEVNIEYDEDEEFPLDFDQDEEEFW